MNDIPRGTSRIKLINFLLAPRFGDTSEPSAIPHVQFGLVMAESRLDDELNVASIEFTDTPKWLQALDHDPCGFPKSTTLGTIWRGVDLNTVDANGQTEFIRAVRQGKHRVNFLYAEMLAEFADTDVNVQDLQGRTALHWACIGAEQDMVRLCLSVPECQIGLLDHDNLTAFDLAFRSGNEAIQRLFYRSIFEIEETEPQTALLRILTVTSEPAPNRSGLDFPGEAMFDPVEASNAPLVKALVARGIDLTATNRDGDTALHLAATKVGNLEITTMLLEAGYDVNARGNRGATPLHYAVQSAVDTTTAQLLLRYGADVSAEDHSCRTALQLAEDNLNGPLVTLLKDKLDNDPPQLTLKAEGQKNLDVELTVVRRDRTDTDGCAVAVEERPVVITVQAGGIDVTDQKGQTALHRAVLDRDQDTVRTLLDMGAGPEAMDQDTYTPLQLAAQAGDTDIVEILLARGAHIETTNSAGNTALHVAAWSGHPDTVNALLASHASIDAKNNIGHQAVHCAAWAGNQGVVDILLAARAQIDAQGNVVQQGAGKQNDVRNILRARRAVGAVGHVGHALLQQLGWKDGTGKSRD